MRQGCVQLPGGDQVESQHRVDQLGASVADERVRQEGCKPSSSFHGVKRDSGHSQDLESGRERRW